MDRYHRQMLLPQIGNAGQAKLAAARVLLVGCGALGSVMAELLVRGGVGFLAIADRDIVEWTNLQRQLLFDEADAREGTPKAVAAARRLGQINSSARVEPLVTDVHAGNVEELAGGERGGAKEGRRGGGREKETGVDLILDGTDNVATRYLLNDVAVKHGIPWVYGGCVGTEGRVMAIRPPHTPCLRCLFPTPPAGETLGTCDTVGVLGPAATATAALQAVAAIKIICGGRKVEGGGGKAAGGNVTSAISHTVSAADPHLNSPPEYQEYQGRRQDSATEGKTTKEVPQRAEGDSLLSIDFWAGRFTRLSLEGARRADCPCCGRGRFDFLDYPEQDGSAASLCGRNTVQIRPAKPTALNLDEMTQRWTPFGATMRRAYFVRCELSSPAGWSVTLFADGRLLVSGTQDVARARSLYARLIGT